MSQVRWPPLFSSEGLHRHDALVKGAGVKPVVAPHGRGEISFVPNQRVSVVLLFFATAWLRHVKYASRAVLHITLPFLLTQQELQRIEQVMHGFPQVLLVTAQLHQLISFALPRVVSSRAVLAYCKVKYAI